MQSDLRCTPTSPKACEHSALLGQPEAGENLARVLTIGTTCQMANVNPLEYLTDLLLRIQTWPANQLVDLLPASWKRLNEAGELPPLNVG